MIRKLFLAALGTLMLAACSNDEEVRKYIDPYLIFDGKIPTGIQLDYLGTATVTAADEEPFVNPAARFNFFGEGERLATVYMDDIRFAAAMPALDIRIPTINYTTNHSQKSFIFAVANVIPEANIADTGYRPYERYVITNFTGTLQGETCTISFTCMGKFHVQYEGRLQTIEQ